MTRRHTANRVFARAGRDFFLWNHVPAGEDYGILKGKDENNSERRFEI